MEPLYFCDNFNRRQFFALSLVFMFLALLALRLDDFIHWPNWVVFFPLWLWQSVIFGGFLFEIFAFCRSPRYYIETQAHFKNAFFDAFFHINLLFFEILACNRLENAHHSESGWVSVFVPLIILSIFGIFVSFWTIKNDFDGDLHFIVSSNILFFIFVALKMEGLIDWSWKFVFLPNWISLVFFFTLEVIEIIMSISRFICVSRFQEYRQQSFCISVGYAISLLLIITSGVLLALKKDSDLHLPYLVIASPLMSALTVFMSLCFSVRSHFQWRRCFQLIYRRTIKMCHPLQEYGNISYKLSSLHQSPSYDQPGRGSNQPISSSGSDFQVVTSTSSSQPLPPPPLQSIRLVRVESPKSPSKSPMEVNVEPQERPFLLSFLLPRRRHSKGVVRKPRCKGGDDGIDIGCPNSALSTRLDAPD